MEVYKILNIAQWEMEKLWYEIKNIWISWINLSDYKLAWITITFIDINKT